MKRIVVILVMVIGLLSFSETKAQETDFLQENRVELDVNKLPDRVKEVLDEEQHEGWKLVAVFRSKKYEPDGADARYLIRLRDDYEFKDVYVDGTGLAYDPWE